VGAVFTAACRTGLAWFEVAVEEELAGEVEFGVPGVTWTGAAVVPVEDVPVAELLLLAAAWAEALPDVDDDAAGVAVAAAGSVVCADEAVEPLVTAAGGVGLA
jgi:hypothetical protein